MASADEVQVKFTAELSGLNKGVAEGNAKLDTMTGHVRKMALQTTTALTAMGRALAIGGAVAFGAAIVTAARNSIQLADALQDVSDRVGVNTNALQGWHLAAEQSGSSGEALDLALGKLVKTLGAARDGSTEAMNAFKAFGPEVEHLVSSGAATEDVVRGIANALRGVKDTTVAANLAIDVPGDVKLVALGIDGGAVGPLERDAVALLVVGMQEGDHLLLLRLDVELHDR